MAAESVFFDTEKLILEVEKRPGIYDKKLPEYSNRITKANLWTEVCDAIINDWDKFGDEEKKQKGKDVQKKWKNLRDSFRKELNLQKNTKSGDGTSKRRKYLYFDQLLFLVSTFENREISGNYTAPMSNSSVEEEQSSTNMDDADVRINEDERLQESSNIKNPTLKRSVIERSKKRKNPSYEESLLKILSESKDDIDEDKSFLLSLLPSMKKLSPQQKLTVKTEYLQIMHKVRYPNDTNVTTSFSQGPNTSLGSPNFSSNTTIVPQQLPQFTIGNNTSYGIRAPYVQAQPPRHQRPYFEEESLSSTSHYYSSFTPSPAIESILSPSSSTGMSEPENY